MRVANKLALALLPCACLVQGISGWLSIQREQAIFEQEVRREERIWGRCVAELVAQVWRDEGAAGAKTAVERLSPLLEDVHLRWVWVDGQGQPLPGALRPRAPDEALAPLSRGEIAVHQLAPGEGQPARMLTYVPLRQHEGHQVAIELEESLATQAHFTQQSLLMVGSSTIAMVGLFVVFALIAGRHLVGRPTRALLELARRVARGEFEERLTLERNDEFGALATEMNAMCASLADARRRLEAETEARVQALERLRHADRLATLGKIGAGVAHELGTPLNVAQGYADLLAKQELPPERVRELAGKIGSVCRRMAETIRRTLDYARRRQPEKRSHDLDRVVTNSLDMVTAMAKREGVALEREGLEELRLEVDGPQLEQVLTNVLVNAIMASPEGGRVEVALTRETREPPERLKLGEAREVACLRVRDEGPGIPAEHMPVLFEPFFTTRAPGEGTGLGLPIAWEIVEGHGGWIEVETAPGEGTTMKVCLPLGAADSVASNE